MFDKERRDKDMLVTSKEANKLLQQLEQEHRSLLSKEYDTKSFLAAVGEDVESCRPEYDYAKVQDELAELENKIIKLKHQINRFNTETIVDGFDKTIDEMLVYIPMLTRRKEKLNGMKNALAKTREAVNMRSTIIDYRYANYDINKALEDYYATLEELSKAQVALDKVNVTKKFEVEL